MTEKRLYMYQGAVMAFGRNIGEFRAKTMAESEKKAANNILFQFKKKYGYVASVKLQLAGKPMLM